MRQLDCDQQAVMSIGCADAPAMQLYRPLCDLESQPNAAAGALARLAYPVERLEDVGQLGFRDARTVIAHREQRRIEPARQ